MIRAFLALLRRPAPRLHGRTVESYRHEAAAADYQRRADTLFAAADALRKYDPAKTRLYCLAFARTEQAEACRLRAIGLHDAAATHDAEAAEWETKARQYAPLAQEVAAHA